jgi:hypothetical protein
MEQLGTTKLAMIDGPDAKRNCCHYEAIFSIEVNSQLFKLIIQ